MSLGIVARADYGGLATQTWEMARHTSPAKILIVHFENDSRGPCHPEWYQDLAPEVTVIRLAPGTWLSDDQVCRWLDGLDVVYTAEGDYGGPLAWRCALRGIKFVVHANPELWSERLRDSTTQVVCPTRWELDRILAARHAPMPVDRQRCIYHQRTQAVVFWHPSAPAFHDRHGTRLVRAAAKLIKRPVELVVSGPEADVIRSRNASVRVMPPRTRYWDGYQEADVLVLPRRYGGLSLPTQEALSCGLPVIMLDTGPYVGHGGVLSVPTTGSYPCDMKGGQFPVYDGDPQCLADEIEELFLHPEVVARASAAADETAAELDWQWLEPTWRALLDAHQGIG